MFKDRFKPAVSKRALLFIAGCVWLIAGGILLSRGLVALIEIGHLLFLDVLIGVIMGVPFYLILFSRISKKHILRIRGMEIPNPCFFSFFSFRSYILMSVMITAGISVRKLGIINPEILYTFFLTMSVPLLISAVRFFVHWHQYSEA